MITLNVFANVETVDESRAGGGREQSGKDGHSRRFPCSVVSQKGRDLTLVHVQVDVVHCHFIL